jgi:hypothetical protein
MKPFLTMTAILVSCTGNVGQALEARLASTIAFDGFRANEIYPTDINGDGRLELLCLQSPGMYKTDNNPHWPNMPESMKSVSCLTAIDASGSVLWQHGTPYLEPALLHSHSADQMLTVGMFSNNGQKHIALLGKNTLSILDAATGNLRRSVELEADNFSMIQNVRHSQGTRLLVQNTAEAYSPYSYGQPASLYDAANLSRIAAIPDAVGSGHSPSALDLNGDGNDEILIGFDAYGANGNRLWTLSGSRRQPTSFYHVDELAVGKLGNPATDTIVYAAQGNVEAGAFDGSLLWQKDFGHPQYVVLGDFRMGNAKASMAVYCCYGQLGSAQMQYIAASGVPAPSDPDARDNIAFLNDAGEIVSLIFPGENYCHSPEGIIRYAHGSPDGSDAIITRDWGWPEVLSMAGETCFLLPEPVHPDGLNPEDGYGIRIVDLNNDGRSEILVHDQLTAWIYERPYPTPEPGTLMLLAAAGLSAIGYAWRRRR